MKRRKLINRIKKYFIPTCPFGLYFGDNDEANCDYDETISKCSNRCLKDNYGRKN
jgi:hypothetical protein